MKTIIQIITIATILTIFTGCADNHRVRAMGGSMTVDLPKGTKLVNATWKKDGELWYLYRPMAEYEKPAESYFQEKSLLGIIEGRVVFKESR